MKSPRGHSTKAAACAKRPIVGLLVLVGCLVSPAASTVARAQDWYLVQGIFDAELYGTDTDSPLLTRNDGDLAALGRLQLWAAFQLSPTVQFYAQGKFEADNFDGSGQVDSDLEQIALRYTRLSAPWLVIEAGKILSPLAAYSDRRLSTQNPLIGQPYLYASGYPWGAKVVGSAAWFDYQAAWIDPSDTDPEYQAIEPDRAFRPALAVGVTPFTGLRFGLSWTQGPYLNRETNDNLPDGRQWRDYEQRAQGLDVQFSRGYLEFNGQLVRTHYEVPYHDSAPDDSTYWLELKYTWTPRLYGAVRYQGVEVTYVGYPEYQHWYTEVRKFSVLEVGIGYRFSPNLLLKFAYQRDHWDEPDYGYAAHATGHALELQLSWFFDLVSLLADEP
jgi:hypothetical protein